MAHSYDAAVELLESARLSTNASHQLSQVRALEELVLRKDPESLVPSLLPAILELWLSASAPVKRHLVDLVEGVGFAQWTPEVAAAACSCLASLSRDAAPSVVRRALEVVPRSLRQSALVLRPLPPDAPFLADADAEQGEAVRRAVGDAVTAVGEAVGKGEQEAWILVDANAEKARIPSKPASAALFAAAGRCAAECAHALLSEQARCAKFEGSAAETYGAFLSATASRLVEGALLPALQASLERLVALQRVAPPATDSPAVAYSRAAGDLAAGAHSFVSRDHCPGSGRLRQVLTTAREQSAGSAQGWPHVTELARLFGLDETSKGSEKAKRLQGRDAPDPDIIRTVAFDPAAQAPPKRARLDPHSPEAASAAVPLTPRPRLFELYAELERQATRHEGQAMARLLLSLPTAEIVDVALARVEALPPREALTPDAAPCLPWVREFVGLAGGAQALGRVLDRMGTEGWEGLGQAAGKAAPEDSVSNLSSRGLAYGAPEREEEDEESPGGAADGEAGAPQGAGATSKARIATVRRVAPFEPRAAALAPEAALGLRLAALRRLLAAKAGLSPALHRHVIARLALASGDLARETVEGLGGQVLALGGVDLLLHWLYVSFAARREEDERGEEGNRQGGKDANFRRENAAVPLYEHVFGQVLELVRSSFPPADKGIVRLLVEAPALPWTICSSFLRAALKDDQGQQGTVALLALRDIVVLRPPSRSEALRFVLETCADPLETGVRDLAVRLVVNRLLDLPGGVEAAVLEFAGADMDALAALEEDVERGGEEDENMAEEAGEGVQEEAKSLSGGEEGVSGDGPHASPQPSSDDLHPARIDPSLSNDHPPLVAASPPPVLSRPPTPLQRADALCALFCALCTRRPALLPQLFACYAATCPSGRLALLSRAGAVAKTLGAAEPLLLQSLRSPAPACAELALRMLRGVSPADSTLPPPPGVADTCLSAWAAAGDPRLLLPALCTLQPAKALAALPSLCSLEKQEDFAEAVRALAAGQAPLPPQRLLEALHVGQCAHPRQLPHSMRAVGLCMALPELFPAQVCAAALSPLLDRTPVPPLLLRTLLQAAAAFPGLRAWVSGSLRALTRQAVFEDPASWRGWCLVANYTAPDSFPALLALPLDRLALAAGQISAQTRADLLRHAGASGAPEKTLAVLRGTGQDGEKEEGGG